MNGQDAPQATPQASASHQYLVVSLAALAVILLVLLQWGMGRWSFLPVLIGLLGVMLRWRMTAPGRTSLDRRIARLQSPLVPLILLAGLLVASEAMDLATPRRSPARGFSLADWLLGGAVLALCIAQYRVQGMTVSIFPEYHSAWRQQRPSRPLSVGAWGGRERQGQPDRSTVQGQQRNPQLVSPVEIGWLVLALPIWAFLAQLCWRLVPAGVGPYGPETPTWRGIVLAWLLVSSVLVVAGLRSYAGQRRLNEREARLFLQDAFWQETGQDQRRLSRWLAWASLRRRRKEQQ